MSTVITGTFFIRDPETGLHLQAPLKPLPHPPGLWEVVMTPNMGSWEAVEPSVNDENDGSHTIEMPELAWDNPDRSRPRLVVSLQPDGRLEFRPAGTRGPWERNSINIQPLSAIDSKPGIIVLFRPGVPKWYELVKR